MYRTYRVLCASFALSFAVMAAHPARAADSSSLTLAGPNPITTTCPVTLTFNGSISGPANSSVTYLWARFVNGKPSDSAPITAAIPASGVLKLAPQLLKVDKSASGFQSYALLITAPAGSSGSVVYFTVTCVTQIVHNPVPVHLANPPPPAPVFVTDAQKPADSADQGLTPPQVCSNHGGIGAGLLCPDIIAKGYLILVWDWNATQDFPAVDGFNIYEVDHGMRKRVAQQTTPQMTMSGLQSPGGGFNGRCYIVTAYKGSAESGDSNQFCVAGNVGVLYTILKTQQWGWRFQHHVAANGANPGPGTNCSDMCMGYYHYANKNTVPLPDDQEVIVWRSYVLFDQSQLAGLSVLKATLTLQIGPAFDQHDNTAYPAGCLTQIGPAYGNFVGNSDWIDADFNAASVLGKRNGRDITIDVTPIVQSWANGSQTNFGFALRNPNEGTGAFDRDVCRADFSPSAILIVEHA